MEEIKLLEIGTWEEKLGVQFEELSNQGLRTFHITPVVKIEIYNYNHFGNQRVLEKISTEDSNKPNQKRILTGFGIIEGNTFVIRDGYSVIAGVFPLERYEIKLLD